MKQLNGLLIGFLIFSFFGFSNNYLNDCDKSQLTGNIPQGENLKINIPLFQYTPNQNVVNKENTDDNNTGDKDRSWYNNVISDISKDEYKISYSKDYGAYQSPNRKNNYRFIYHNDGFTVKPRITSIPLFDMNDKMLKEEEKKYKTLEYWKIKFSLTGYSRGNENTKFSGSDMEIGGNTAFIEDDNMKISYLNDERGMRQDFIIKKKPEGKSNSISLDFKIDTRLKTEITKNGILFINKKNEKILQYNNLNVTDANGNRLNAYFKKQSGKRYKIIVEDERAMYPITIDPISATPNWTAESNQANAQFGYSVSTAGDVNGDGYSDIIVGAPHFDNGQTDEGRVYVYHGSSSGLSSTENWTAESNQASSLFGYSVSTAGDVNGDGYSDVIVGAYGYDNGDENEGRVYVYHGSSSGLLTTSNWTSESNQTNAFFGYSVSTAGDVNGDSYSDVIIGAPFYNAGETDEGRAYVFLGSSTGVTSPSSWRGESNQASAYFGWSVCTAGDVNGDGYSDVIVGAPYYDSVQTDEGRTYVYHGSSTGLSLTANWTAESNQASSYFSTSVSTAGDRNGDGYSDVIVGAPYYDGGGFTDAGKVSIYYGSSAGLSSTANYTIENTQVSAHFGCSVSTAGDVDGDGYSDVIIGANGYENGEPGEGRAYVYYSDTWTAEGNQVSANFGSSVSTAGDVNGDGYSDVIVGANGYDNGQTNEGRAYVYYGSPSGPSEYATWNEESNQVSANFGWSVSTAGDVNGDGYSDVIVGALHYDNGETDEGRVYVFYGSSSGLSSTANWTAESNQEYANFGYSVSTAGDVNGDGYSDVIVGAYAYDNGETNEGRSYVYHGSASGLSTTANWTAESNQASANFGLTVSTAGDVNGDGYSDVIVGAPYYDNGQLDEGRAYIYHGSPSGLSSAANRILESNQASVHFGFTVSIAGDVNGDGYSDVIVGANFYSNGQDYEGKAFVYHGSSTGLSSTANWTAESDQVGAYFGWSVSTASDRNGDGFSDVIIGAPYYNESGYTDAGGAFFYNGSSTGLSLSWNLKWTVLQANTYFGWSVSTAGDVDGDGLSDLIVGAPYYSNGETNEGRVSIIYSGLWNEESNQAYSDFGRCVSTAGDVNGDGYSDVIIGAPSYDAGETDEGRVFVYYGNDGGLRSKLQQYKPGTTNVIGPQGLSGTFGSVRLNIFGKSPFGRVDGKIVYEIKQEGQPFSGYPIKNSTLSTGSGSYTDLGTVITGVQLNQDISGLEINHEYKWRARIQYNPINNPYQKFGPWKYYTCYQPKSPGGFKTNSISSAQNLNLTLKVYLEGFWNGIAHVSDTIKVYLANSSSPYALVDSQKVVLSTSGIGNVMFSRVSSGNYYIVIKHRNHLETWSVLPQTFDAGSYSSYNFTTAQTSAYGNNLKYSNGAWCIYGGDINQDGFIDLLDLIPIDNDAYNYVSGYVVTDVNGDMFVDLLDMIFVDNNSYNYVGVIKPGGIDTLRRNVFLKSGTGLIKSPVFRQSE